MQFRGGRQAGFDEFGLTVGVVFMTLLHDYAASTIENNTRPYVLLPFSERPAGWRVRPAVG
jgi:hypothetical protein